MFVCTNTYAHISSFTTVTPDVQICICLKARTKFVDGGRSVLSSAGYCYPLLYFYQLL